MDELLYNTISPVLAVIEASLEGRLEGSFPITLEPTSSVAVIVIGLFIKRDFNASVEVLFSHSTSTAFPSISRRISSPRMNEPEQLNMISNDRKSRSPLILFDFIAIS